MCLPEPVSAALAVAQAGLSLARSSAVHRDEKRAAAERADAIRARTIADYESVQSRRREERDAAARDLQESRQAAVAARAHAAVVAGEAGLAGRSVAAGQRAIAAAEGRHRAAVLDADLAADHAARRELHAIGLGAAAERASVRRPRIPDYWAQGVRLAGKVGGLERSLP